MFYNTNISTYIWLVTNNKKHKGRVKLISASSEEFYRPMTKSLGKKRHEMTPEQITKLTKLFMSDEESKYVKVFDNEDFGYSKVVIENPKSIKELEENEKFLKLARNKKILRKNKKD